MKSISGKADRTKRIAAATVCAIAKAPMFSFTCRAFEMKLLETVSQDKEFPYPVLDTLRVKASCPTAAR